MSHSRNTRLTRLVSGLTAGAVLLLVPSAAVAGTGDENDPSPRDTSQDPARECVYDERFLPRTPDAIEGWYRSCLTGH
jgi:hypothetical protein